MGLSPQSNHQFSMFDKDLEKQKKLMKSIDSIDNKYGLYQSKTRKSGSEKNMENEKTKTFKELHN